MADLPDDQRDVSEEETGAFEGPATKSIAAAGAGPRNPPPIEGAAATPAAPAFQPDELISDRYRVVRYIAAGAMGEVYEVEDRALRERVALKTIAPEIAERPRAIARFKREIQLARRVSHANACRIHEFGSHKRPGPDGTPREILFLTMELLAGETLAERIAAKKRLSPTEALPILEQVAAALDAAHTAGVIHRDFKSSNVMLGSQRASGGVRAVVTDFGLARSVASDDGASISDTGIVVGTPAYMAPEQVRGEDLTPESDVYAFGIVMYEMVTGSRPFEGGSAMSVAVRRLTEPPQPPRERVPDLAPSWEETILRCLELDPLRRFHRASDAVRVLRTASAAAGQGFDPLRSLRAWPSTTGVRYGLPAVLVLVAATLYVATQRKSNAPPATPAVSTAAAPRIIPRRTLAVLGLSNVSGRGEADWVSTAVSEILTTDLGSGGELRTIPAQEVTRARAELDLRDLGSLPPAAAARFHDNLGADLLVVGSYTALQQAGGRLLRIDLHLVDAGSGRVLSSGGATGTEAQLFELVARAAAPLRKATGLESLSPTQAVALERSLPSNRDAARLYLEGLAKLRVADALAAKDLFGKAVAAEPRHPLPHSGLAAAWLALGFERAAREEAKAAAELAATLPEHDRLGVEARYYETSKQWPKAIEAYRRVWEKNPDDLDTALLLADAQTRAGSAKEALATLDALATLPPALSADPRIDLARARAYQRLSDSKQQLASASAAARKANGRGARLLVARARQLEAAALETQGHKPRAMAALEEARSLYETLGDRAGLARVLERMAIGYNSRGDLDGARRLFDRALETYRASGDKSGTARVLQNTGNVLLGQGRLPEAQKLYEESLTTFRQVGAKYEEAAALTDLGAGLQLAGDLAGAAKRYEQALALFGEVGRKNMVALTLTNLAEVMFLRGDLRRAESMHEEALALNRELGDKAGQAYDLTRLGDVFAARSDLEGAERNYDQALQLQKELEDEIGSAECRLGTAAVKAAEGRLAEAEALIHHAEETFRTGGATDRQAVASARLVENLVAQKKLPEAREVGEALQKLVEGTKDRMARWEGSIALARLGGASGKPDGAHTALVSLEGVRTDASRAGFLPPQLESRLAMAEIEVSSGRGASGRTRLKALATEAEAKGFVLVARRARAIR